MNPLSFYIFVHLTGDFTCCTVLLSTTYFKIHQQSFNVKVFKKSDSMYVRFHSVTISCGVEGRVRGGVNVTVTILYRPSPRPT